MPTRHCIGIPLLCAHAGTQCSRWDRLASHAPGWRWTSPRVLYLVWWRMYHVSCECPFQNTSMEKARRQLATTVMGWWWLGRAARGRGAGDRRGQPCAGTGDWGPGLPRLRSHPSRNRCVTECTHSTPHRHGARRPRPWPGCACVRVCARVPGLGTGLRAPRWTPPPPGGVGRGCAQPAA